MKYRKLNTDFPIETLKLLIETYFRSVSAINDDEEIRIIEFGKWDIINKILPIKITLGKEIKEEVKSIRIHG